MSSSPDSRTTVTPQPDMETRIARLFIYPVKSCGGVEVAEALLTETGLDLDRAWMVVDEQGGFVSQRELPRMALISVRLKHYEVVLRAPGMLALHLSIDAVEAAARVRVWDDEVDAYDMGDTAAQWFSDFLGSKLRLVRFDPEQRRLSNMKWTGGEEALIQFSDGYPLLVVSEGSLAELNRRLAASGHDPVTITRFRPNIVLAGLEAHDEDRIDLLHVGADEEVLLKPAKPCSRCPVPNIDPETAEATQHVTDVLQAYRRNDLVGGAATFGMNMIIGTGVEQVLRVGQPVTASWRF